MSRSNIITTENIWNITNNGEKIFEREIGNISYNKNVSSPFRADQYESFKLKPNNNGIICGQDFGGNNWYGNGISLIMELYSLTFPQAIERIWKDFNGDGQTGIKKIINSTKIIKKPLIFEFNDCRFTDNHKRYFDKYHLDENFLNSRDVWAVDKWAIDKKIQIKISGEYNFAYVPKNENGNVIDGQLKILSLGVDPKKKWKTNIFNTFLWHLHTIPKDCENLFIVKSVKDGCVLSKLGLNCIETQNESAILLLQNNFDKIENLAKNKIVAYGSDFQAYHQSYLLTYVTGWKHFNVDNELEEKFGIDDFAEYVMHFSENSLRNKLKAKKYL